MNFIGLFMALDKSHSTNSKVNHLEHFFRNADPLEASWGAFLLLGYPRKRKISHSILKKIGINIFQGPEWLFMECYSEVGDLAETLSLLFSNNMHPIDTVSPVLIKWINEHTRLSMLSVFEIEATVKKRWHQFNPTAAFLYNKLATGGFRIGVSRGIISKALSQATGITRERIEERLLEKWIPNENWLKHLSRPVDDSEFNSSPLPFCLSNSFSYSNKQKPSTDKIQVEFKWDGMRAQIIIGQNNYRIWSRGDHDISHQFPDILESVKNLPENTIIDGEILILREGIPQPFQDLQSRMNRKYVSKALIKKYPAYFRAYDLLRLKGVDFRLFPLRDRRMALENLPIDISKILQVETWDQIQKVRDKAREFSAEGLMIKNINSKYLSGRKANTWWKWKLDPLNADLVLIYAQPGHGKRAGIHSDYTLAAQDHKNRFVPVTKCYSGLTNVELKQIDSWIRKNTKDKFGPVRQVEPCLIFEIAFDSISLSHRRKCGLAMRFPRIIRWRKDKTDITTIDELKLLLDQGDKR